MDAAKPRGTSRPTKPQGVVSSFFAGASDWDSHRPGATDSVGVSALSYLLSGPIAFALIGWGLDAWLGTSFLVLIGLLAGMALSIYLIWFRYGSR